MQIILNSELKSQINEHSINIEQRLSYAAYSAHNPGKGFQYKAVDYIPQSNLYNRGFVGLLSKAYSEHLPVAIAPHDIWIVLLSEVTKEVAEHAEQYRSLFTQSQEKQLLTVMSGSMTHMPMEQLSTVLSQHVQFNSDVLFPEFSTQTPIVKEVIQAIFCDMASPYYDYGMFCCGIPRIELLGTVEDWKLLQQSWLEILTVFNSPAMHQYSKKITPILEQFVQAAQNNVNLDFWKNIFTQENVGSGGDLTIDGWITDLFMTKHDFPKITNFTSTHGAVKYTQLNTKREFVALYGGFHAQVNANGFYQLQYHRFVFEKVPQSTKY